ncbi:MAG TPA: 5-deoxy-glucuronate isomerase [Candidatus Hydrogenedentes bacterium]|mgnify:FL=1|nr:5-deoxy-glucuronate isomerase [Candidatus Hydrogenedentota bacterium]HRT18788.1 5-deoxy-glucuronate isomerase [Candidatus Hydrogenedentota bacterium]HRT65766.1 5-deoxy-glucuronate isomerase [Candidatus Hydrogenedentota bacterium]
MHYTAENLIIHPSAAHEDGLLLSITPETAGWNYISFQGRRLGKGEKWSFDTRENELALVPFGGRLSVRSNRGAWPDVGGREDVFSGAAHVLYLPRRTAFTVTASTACDFAVAWVPTNRDADPFLIAPTGVPISIRGGDHACRQINDLLPPGSPVHRLVLVEVYTPGGNWSSYPPHKHDVHVEENGKLVEAELEEVYFFKFDRPEGYAFQWVYTDAASPLQRAGNPIDAVVRPENNCAVLVPGGYHPVSSPPGYTTYYLNVLAGSAQSLANQDDPRYAWVKHTYKTTDERLPLYNQ